MSQPATILIVDDDVDLLDTMGTLCRRRGFDVHVAPDAEAALRVVEVNVPGVVLTDLRLPGMSGLDLIRALRAVHPRLPIILLTAFGSDEVVELAGRYGACSILTKPVMREDLFRVIGGALAAGR